MNFKKMQIDVCNAMLNPDSWVAVGEVGDNYIAVTTDNVTAYVFSKEECIFNPEKIERKVDMSEMFKWRDDDKLLEKTLDMQAHLSGDKAVKFVADDLEVWINEKYVNNFRECNFYAYAPLNRVLVCAPGKVQERYKCRIFQTVAKYRFVNCVHITSPLLRS